MTQDHLGSPRIITDRDGKVISRKDYSAFGEATMTSQRTANPEYAGQAELTRKDYTGYEKDDESGLEYAQARYYNSSHGRFTSVDPLTASATIKNPQTFNRYSYVLNSPYKFTDPLGLLPEGAGCNFRCRVNNAINNGSKLSADDLALAQFHVANGTALGYSFVNAVQSRQSQQQSPVGSNRSRTVALAAKVSKNQSDETAFLNRAKQATSEVKQFSTGEDIIDALIDFSESGVLDRIVIHDHGFEGGIIGDEQNVGLYTMGYASSLPKGLGLPDYHAWQTTEDFADFVKSGKINIAKNGSIVIYGCNCSNIAQELSSKLGQSGRGDISVTGANNAVYEKSGKAYVDRRTDGISKGSRGSFITYRNGIEVSTSSTRSYQ